MATLEWIKEGWSKDETDLEWIVKEEESGLEPLIYKFTIDADSGEFNGLEPYQMEFKKTLYELKDCDSIGELEDELSYGGYIWKSKEIKEVRERKAKGRQDVTTTKSSLGVEVDTISFTDSTDTEDKNIAFLLGKEYTGDGTRARHDVKKSATGISVAFSTSLLNIIEE